MKKISDNIFLIGYMGTGKTSVAKCIGSCFDMTILDIDSIIEEREDLCINDIFERKGEKYFRTIEAHVLQSLEGRTNIVVSCGGGIIIKEENIKCLKGFGKVVLLNSSASTIYNRIRNCSKRPLLNKNMSIDFIENMLKNRYKKYLQAADIIIDNENKSINEISKEIIANLTV